MYPTSVPSVVRTAMYLRCYPFDRWEMANHQSALRGHAEFLALPRPVLHLDNGIRSCEVRPSLEHLLNRAADGAVHIVLVPGLFVFSLFDDQARAVARRLRRMGCAVVELPSPYRAHVQAMR
ncbi:hypothetical protein [Kitasatospora sp. NPDC057015]|uniref:hypothetical protein n=1 Tax=Kitasatospora sp. NPDC057015 TaxID=3346001 RepID=UPI00362ACB8D